MKDSRRLALVISILAALGCSKNCQSLPHLNKGEA